jgi:hypothetical protein
MATVRRPGARATAAGKTLGWTLLRRAAVIAFATMAVLRAVGPVEANQGVRISTGRIDVQDRLPAGGTYHLPDIEVSNPGSERASYELAVGEVAGQTESVIEPGWVAFSPTSFALDAAASRVVSVSLAIPADASQGSYSGLLKAQLVPASGTVAIGAAAAARLTFTVAEPTNALDAAVSGIRNALDAAAPWPLVILVVLAILIVGRAARRRFDIRIERRR